MSELIYNTLFGDSSLAAYWRFEGDSTDAVVLNANNGTDTSITYSTANGQYGRGAGFNGTTSKILVADATSLKQTGSITLAAWVNPTSLGSTMVVLQKGREAANQLRYGLQIGTTGKVTFRVVAGAGRSEATTATLSSGVWSHIAVTCNINGGTNATFYINGSSSSATVTDASNPTYDNAAETNQFGIGTASDSSGFFGGAIDDACLFGRELNGTEILSLYTASPPTGAAIFF